MTSHILIVLFHSPDAVQRSVLSGEMAIVATLPSSTTSTSHFHDDVSHIRNTPSLDPEAKCFPSGEKVKADGESEPSAGEYARVVTSTPVAI
jgi:hypothetical protein